MNGKQAGLGRLAYDIFVEGFSTMGNEFSFHMLIGSDFILNTLVPAVLDEGAPPLQLQPYCHHTCNVRSVGDILHMYQIPGKDTPRVSEGIDGEDGADADADQHRSRVIDEEPFCMSGGDFLEIFRCPEERGLFDCVATCFFLDTAANVIDYIETIRHVLRPNGVWINLGPLLYHFANVHRARSVEYTKEELRDVIVSRGFCFIKEESKVCTYTTRATSMMKNVYTCWFFVVRLQDVSDGEEKQ
jgi:carnosine N-methyltransferase